MKILITGATGLIGKEIGKKLVLEGHTLIITSRDQLAASMNLPFPAQVIEWNSHVNDFPLEALSDVEAVINLAGESIGSGRWTHKRKEEIYQSRVMGTKKIVEAIHKLTGQGHSKVKHFISASAIGIYGNDPQITFSEDSPGGSDFLSEVCRDWENEAMKLSSFSIRVVIPRIGIVLARQGGALLKMLPVFGLGLGGVIGNGRQWMSWIHLDDLVNIFSYCLKHNEIEGAVNAVAPEAVTNKVFSRKLAEALGKRLFFPIPGLVIKIILGEMATLVLGSQKVIPAKLNRSGFKFLYSDITTTLSQICLPLKSGQKELLAEQWISQSPQEVFQFFSDENNLEKLTPPFLNFKVLGKSTPELTQGTLINYKLALYGIPFHWKTRIEIWEENIRFVDEQLKGP